MHPDDILKTAIITPFGLFEFLRLLFDLRNAGSTFQRMIYRMLSPDFPSSSSTYMTSLWPASPWSSTRRMWRRCSAASGPARLVINGEKCKFEVWEVQFLAHHVTAEGIRPLPGRVAAIKDNPRPSTVKQLQAFLGSGEFLPPFCAGSGQDFAALTDSLKGGLKATAAV